MFQQAFEETCQDRTRGEPEENRSTHQGNLIDAPAQISRPDREEMASLMTILRENRRAVKEAFKVTGLPKDHPSYARYDRVTILVYDRIAGFITKEDFRARIQGDN
jgi:hypothetical protein